MTFKKFITYLCIISIFTLPFIPAIVGYSMFFPYIVAKNLIFRICVELALGSWIILMFLDSTYRPKKSFISYALLLYVVIVAIADLNGMNPFKSMWSNFERMEGFVTYLHMFALFIVAGSILKTEQIWHKWFNVVIGVSASINIYGLYELLKVENFTTNDPRLQSTLGNAIYLAVFELFVIIFCFIFFFRKNRKAVEIYNPIMLGINAGFAVMLFGFFSQFSASNAAGQAIPFLFKFFLIPIVLFNVVVIVCRTFNAERILYAVLALCSFFILYHTGTRGTILGLLVGLLVGAGILAFKEKENKVLQKSSLAFILIIAVSVVGFYSIRNTQFVQHNPILSRFANISPFDKSQGRSYIWPMAIKGMQERPLIGWGQESFNYIFNKYYDPQMYGLEQWFDRSHNIVLDVLVQSGFIGLFVYLSIFVFVLYYLWKKTNFEEPLIERTLLTALIVAYFIHNLVVFDNIVSIIFITAIFAYIHARSTQNVLEKTTELTSDKLDQASYVVLPFVLILLSFSLYYSVYKPYAQNVALIAALQPHQDDGGLDKNLSLFNETFSYQSSGQYEAREQLVSIAKSIISSPQVPDKTKNDFFSLVRTQYDQQLKETPQDARYYLFYGTFLSDIINQKDPTAYIPLLERARDLSPKKQGILFQLGQSYIYAKQMDKAVITFKQAYEEEPSFEAAAVTYASVLILQKSSEALAEAARVLASFPDASKQPTIIEALKATNQTLPSPAK